MISSAEACHYVIEKPRKIESESIWKSVRGSKGFNWTRTLCSANSFRDWTQSIPFICFSKYNVWSKFERNGKKVRDHHECPDAIWIQNVNLSHGVNKKNTKVVESQLLGLRFISHCNWNPFHPDPYTILTRKPVRLFFQFTFINFFCHYFGFS